MSGIEVSFSTKLSISLRGIGKVLRRPLALLLSLLIAFLVITFFVWLPNIGLLFELGKLPSLTYLDKTKVFFEGVGGLFTNFTDFQALSILVIALLMGINIVVLLKIGASRAAAAGSGGSFVVALFGTGCAACGTSIFAPVIASLAAVTSVGFVEVFGLAANLIGIALLVFSLYRLGIQAASTAS